MVNEDPAKQERKLLDFIDGIIREPDAIDGEEAIETARRIKNEDTDDHPSDGDMEAIDDFDDIEFEEEPIDFL